MQFLFHCPVIGHVAMHESDTEADFKLVSRKVILIQLLFAIQTKQHRTWPE